MKVDQKQVTTLLIIVVVVVLLVVFSKFFKGIFDGLGSITKPFQSKDNLDKQQTSSENAAAQNAKNGAHNGITEDSVSIAKANELHTLLDTFYFGDLFSIAGTTHLDDNDSLKVNNLFINNNSGAQMAKIIISYGVRNLPARSGAVTGILYDTTKGTLREHFSKFLSDTYKDGGTNGKTKILAYYDKVSNDYLS